jgi:hypothetical protein
VVLLCNLKPDQTFELQPKDQLPIASVRRNPINQRPALVDELVTVRYENILDEAGWEQLPLSDHMKSWLNTPRLQASSKLKHENKKIREIYVPNRPVPKKHNAETT